MPPQGLRVWVPIWAPSQEPQEQKTFPLGRERLLGFEYKTTEWSFGPSASWVSPTFSSGVRTFYGICFSAYKCAIFQHPEVSLI
jgi:hypothetical protein